MLAKHKIFSMFTVFFLLFIVGTEHQSSKITSHLEVTKQLKSMFILFLFACWWKDLDPDPDPDPDSGP